MQANSNSNSSSTSQDLFRIDCKRLEHEQPLFFWDEPQIDFLYMALAVVSIFAWVSASTRRGGEGGVDGASVQRIGFVRGCI